MTIITVKLIQSLLMGTVVGTRFFNFLAGLFVPLSGGSWVALSKLQIAEEDLFWHAKVLQCRATRAGD